MGVTLRVMAWRPLPRTPPPQQATEPRLRILNRSVGYLNLAARTFLFGAKSGRVLIEENDAGPPWLSIVAAEDGEGQAVSSTGHLSVRQLTKRASAAPPFSLHLLASDAGGRRRLALGGIVATLEAQEAQQ